MNEVVKVLIVLILVSVAFYVPVVVNGYEGGYGYDEYEWQSVPGSDTEPEEYRTGHEGHVGHEERIERGEDGDVPSATPVSSPSVPPTSPVPTQAGDKNKKKAAAAVITTIAAGGVATAVYVNKKKKESAAEALPTVSGAAGTDQPVKPPEPTVTPSETDLQKGMGKIIKEKEKEGYFVRNPTLIKKAWNNSLGRLVEAVRGQNGGQCGEFSKWGKGWSKDLAEKIYGKGTIVTDITARKSGFTNHTATRLIPPNGGTRKVLDYHESMIKGKPMIYDEKDWIANQRKKFGVNPTIDRSTDEIYLKQMINQYGEKRGIDHFLKQAGEKGRTLIDSYKKDPW